MLYLLGAIANYADEIHADQRISYYTDALGLAEPRRMRPLVAHCHAGLAKRNGRIGHPD